MKLPVHHPPQGADAQAAHEVADPHGMNYDSPLFFDKQSLQGELHRVFEICNGCRLCYSLCPSFTVMLNRIDELDPHASETSGKHLQMAGEVDVRATAGLSGTWLIDPNQVRANFRNGRLELKVRGLSRAGLKTFS